MSLKKVIHSHKKEKHTETTEQENIFKSLTAAEMNQIAMEMSWGYGMLPSGFYPYGFWYFY